MATATVDVYVKLPTGRVSSFQMQPSDTVSKIYERIGEEEHIPAEQVLIKYTGKILQKHQTLGYLGVCRETILKAEIIQVKKLNIFVRLPDEETIQVEIENVSPLRYIKDQIHTLQGHPPDRQVLKLGKIVLHNANQKVMDAGITNETTLDLEVKEKADSRHVDLTKTGNNGATNDCYELNETDKDAVLGSFDSSGKKVEVVFSFDTTGSMYSCLEQVRSRLRETVQRLVQHIPSVRIGIMAHGDYCDYTNYVLRSIDLTSDVDRLVDFVENVPSTGGGDAPECYEWVLKKAQELDWGEDSAKALVVIGDCPPHEVSYTTLRINWHDELDVLAGMGVKVYGVRAQNNETSTPFYQEISEKTGGAYITFKNFEIISDMFLAVCYKEASEAQFEAFCDEVQQETNLAAGGEATAASKKADDVKAVLNQIQEQKDRPQDRPRKYVSKEWWDPALDRGSPQYTYSPQTDSWRPYTSTANIFKSLNASCLSGGDTSHDRVSSFLTSGTSAAESKTTAKTKSRFSFRRSRSSRKDSSAGVTSMKKVDKCQKCCIM